MWVPGLDTVMWWSWLSHDYIPVTIKVNRNNLREEEFPWAHSFPVYHDEQGIMLGALGRGCLCHYRPGNSQCDKK